MNEINLSNDVYPDMFSLRFGRLFSTVNLISLEMKENCTVGYVEKTTNQRSKRVVFRQRTTETTISFLGSSPWLEGKDPGNEFAEEKP